jgi:hypothetical protein
MADKKNADSKPIEDVAKPGKSAPSDTAKPIITHRPMMKDPMVNESAADTISEDSPSEKIIVKTGKSTIQPLAGPEPKTEEPAPAEKPSQEPAPAEQPKKETKPEPKPEAQVPEPVPEPEEPGDNNSDGSSDDKPGEEKAKSAAEKSEQDAQAEQAKHDEEIQKLVDSKQYVLPINAVEKRKSKHFVIFGVILAIFLAVAWADVALDAGLVDIGGVKPVTHFFSN